MSHSNWEESEAWQTLRAQWSLRPGVRYLNHGSFGPAPRVVLAARREWTERLESEPMDFFLREMEPQLQKAREQLGRFLGTAADNLVFVDNCTYGMNVVANSFPLSAHDEVLFTNHEYGAVHRIWERRCARSGARIVVRDLPEPFESAAELVEAFMAGVTDRTRLIVISHVTSPTALILPVAEICQRARSLGVAVCIDGPHALAMTAVDLSAIDCDFYVASCHKWLCAPFGSGLLYVHPRWQGTIEPIMVSWGRTPAGQSPSWRDELTWQGTRDPAAFLSVTTALEFFTAIGWDAFRERTHGLARLARGALLELTELQPLSADSSQWYGSMVTVRLAAGEAAPLQQALWEQYQIEIPVIEWGGRRWIRPSCHLYNDRDDIDALITALKELLPRH